MFNHPLTSVFISGTSVILIYYIKAGGKVNITAHRQDGDITAGGKIGIEIGLDLSEIEIESAPTTKVLTTKPEFTLGKNKADYNGAILESMLIPRVMLNLIG